MRDSRDTYRSYETYFGTKKYQERYPRPNRLAFARVLRAAPRGATVTDIGAGNGRYAIPLAEAGYTVLAVERSDVAREQLAAAAQKRGLEEKVLCFKDLEDVDKELAASSRLALLFFGVLGHMTFKEREATLKTVQSTMGGRAEAIGSVPNKFRRYKTERANARIDDFGKAERFIYTHDLDGVTHSFEYTAFSPNELREEIALHGWECVQMKTESILSEKRVTTNLAVGMGDSFISRMTPRRFAHAIFFHIRMPTPLDAWPQ
jgi:SAM-dependent methyltransferase